MIIDRVVVAAGAELGDDALRLAERIGADEDAAAGLGVEAVDEAVNLAAGVGVAEDGQAEGRLGDEDVAGDGDERGTGRIGAALVVARDNDLLAAMLEDDLGRTEDMAGGDEADVDLADADGFAIGDGVGRLLAVADVHDRQRLGGGPHRAMAAAGMVGMAVGDERAVLGLRGIDPRVGGFDEDALGKGLDPAAETGHAW